MLVIGPAEATQTRTAMAAIWRIITATRMCEFLQRPHAKAVAGKGNEIEGNGRGSLWSKRSRTRWRLWWRLLTRSLGGWPTQSQTERARQGAFDEKRSQRQASAIGAGRRAEPSAARRSIRLQAWQRARWSSMTTTDAPGRQFFWTRPPEECWKTGPLLRHVSSLEFLRDLEHKRW